jgi:hypothetical protein
MREDEPDGLLEPTLDFRTRWIGPRLGWFEVWRARLAQECLR